MQKTVVHLVDDDAAVRGTLARLLASGGYRVVEYASGRALLDAAQGIDSGYILLDINMPEPDGFAVQKALGERAIEVPRATPGPVTFSWFVRGSPTTCVMTLSSFSATPG